MTTCPTCHANLALVGTRHRCVANTPIAVANEPEPVANSEIYSRYRNKDARREYMRAYMRKRRKGPQSQETFSDFTK